MENYDFDGYGGALSWTSQYEAEEIYFHSDFELEASIPDKFDLRTVGGASPVKDKGKKPEGIGICWLFAAIASMESNLLYSKKASDQDSLYIQSELHGAYSTFDISDGDKEYENPRGRKPGVKDETQKPAYGGMRYMAVNYLTRDVGTTPWNLDPYYKEDMEDQILKKRKWDITEHKPGKYYVKEVRYLPDPVPPGHDPNFILLVKNYVMKYGGVSCSILWNDEFVNDLGGEEFSYYDNTSGNHSNHAVTIMGWDDTYPVDHFKIPPQNPGAFLVKNCWGSLSAGGYLWVSYESANFGGRSYCVTDVATDYYNDTVKIYQHDNYGYNDTHVPYSDGNRRYALAKNSFGAVPGDKLIGISFYVCSACYVTLGCSEKRDVIVKDYACPTPGYYTYELAKPITIDNDSFSVTVKYRSATNLPAYIPLEVNDNNKIFIHWKIDDSKSSVYQSASDSWVPVSELHGPKAGAKYGYFCMKAIMKNDSSEISSRKEVYDDLKAPAIHDGYTEILPNEKVNETLEWRLEPYRSSDYSKTYKNSVVMFEVDTSGGKSYGLVNTGAETTGAYLVATIGDGNDCMRKIFRLDIGPVSDQYSFTCGDVDKYDCRSTIQGTFPIPGAVVKVKANNNTEETTVDSDLTWKLENFELYDITQGWEDKYTNTTVTIEIKSKDGLLLSKGIRYISLECPMEKREDGDFNLYTIAGLFTAGIVAAAGIYGTYYLCRNLSLAGAGAPIPGGSGLSLKNGTNNSHVNIDNQGFEPLVGEARELYGIRYTIYKHKYKVDCSGNAEAERKGGGCLVNKISKGGSVTNCKVTGSVSNVSNLSGLFYEGEDVTVKNCDVDLDVDSCDGIYAGVAVNLSGSKNSITDITVAGKVQADKIAGLVQTMEGGCIKNSGVSLDARAQTSLAGILEAESETEVSNSIVAGSGSTAGGKAAGVVLSMKGGSIKNCRVSAVLSGSEGAFGIAGTMESGAKIETCYSACKLTATDTVVCGIAEGIEESPDSISGCVSVGSHFSASRAARVSLYANSNCVAYDSITGDGSFISAGELLKSADNFFTKSLYEELKWDFTVWNMEDKECFPVIQDGRIVQTYDYPFLYPQPPESGKFEYMTGQVIAIMGVKNNRMKQITWNLSPHLDTTNIASGESEFLENENDFYIQIAALPIAGDYDLTLTSILDDHKYDTHILLHII